MWWPLTFAHAEQDILEMALFVPVSDNTIIQLSLSLDFVEIFSPRFEILNENSTLFIPIPTA